MQGRAKGFENGIYIPISSQLSASNGHSASQITIHPVSEHEPVPLHIYHYPYCLSFAFFEVRDEKQTAGDEKDDSPTQTETILVDPSYEEEACCNGDVNASFRSCSLTNIYLSILDISGNLCGLLNHVSFSGILTVGVNSHEEVCALQQRGSVLTAHQIELCIKLACSRAKLITDIIKKHLATNSDTDSKRFTPKEKEIE